MARAKQASKRMRLKTALPIWGAAGVSFAMAGSASAAVAPTANTPLQPTAPLPILTLGEEEISDVSLATFYVFDNETFGTQSLGVQLARACGGGRCGGGGGRCAGAGGRCAGAGGRCAAGRCAAGGCAGRCAGGCRCGCGVGGCGVGVVTCAGCSCSCCLSWGACRVDC